MKGKKVLSLLMAVIFILGVTAVPAFAVDEQEDIQLRWNTCDNCNERMYETIEWGNYLQTAVTRKCTDGYTYGLDRQWRKTGIVKDVCANCGYAKKLGTKYLYQWKCHGYD